MAALNAVVFSASIDNENAIRRWIESVQEAAGAAERALDDLAGVLAANPHISITLHRSANNEGAES